MQEGIGGIYGVKDMKLNSSTEELQLSALFFALLGVVVVGVWEQFRG